MFDDPIKDFYKPEFLFLFVQLKLGVDLYPSIYGGIIYMYII